MIINHLLLCNKYINFRVGASVHWKGVYPNLFVTLTYVIYSGTLCINFVKQKWELKLRIIMVCVKQQEATSLSRRHVYVAVIFVLYTCGPFSFLLNGIGFSYQYE
jgi:hypothetical protein